jgi:hypothetical protein
VKRSTWRRQGKRSRKNPSSTTRGEKSTTTSYPPSSNPCGEATLTARCTGWRA